LYGDVLGTGEEIGRVKWPKLNQLRQSNALRFSLELLQFITIAATAYPVQGTVRHWKCVLRIITMTEMLVEIVINEVKSRCILWDMKHKSYHDQLLMDREWSKIAKKCRRNK
jgi:membrane protein YdbS with pleckstrin-like domain